MSTYLLVDFLNTLRMKDKTLEDSFCRDIDVSSWMSERGLLTLVPIGKKSAGALLANAQEVREFFRSTLRRTHAGREPDLKRLNRLLSRTTGYTQLQNSGLLLRAIHIYTGEPSWAPLGPLLDAFAQLLTSDNIGKMRECMAQDCVLWFFDASSGGRRKFCSAGSCGSRTRVAAHRAKQAATLSG